MKIYYTLILAFFFSTNLMAEVDMRNGNFYDTWEDLSVPSDSVPLKIFRYYNSRSLFSGLFGFGWCSDLETHLTTTVEGNVSITECGGGQEILFSGGSYNPQKITSNIEQILEKIKSQKRNLGSAFLNDLKEKLTNDEAYRKKISSDLGIINPTNKSASSFYSIISKADRVEFDGSVFTRNLPSGSVQKFDTQGKLIYLQKGSKEFFKISYNGNKIVNLIDAQARKLNFNYNPSGKLKNIIGPSSIQSEYKFDGENLVSVTNGWGNKYFYQYDSVHNLTKVNYPDGTHRQLAYDENKDLIKSFKDRSGCTETFDYTISQDDPKMHYWTTAEKKCDGKTISSSKYEFWHKERPDKQKALTRILSTVKGQKKDITLDPSSGRPISVREGTTNNTFDYFENGLLRSKISRDETKPNFIKTIYGYDRDFRLNSIASSQVDSKGGESAISRISYSYNERGLLSEIAYSNGKIQLGYDKEFKVNKIVNGSKSYTLSYESNFTKPKLIKSESQTLEISYNQSGDILGVKGTGGPEAVKRLTLEFAGIMALLQPTEAKI